MPTRKQQKVAMLATQVPLPLGCYYRGVMTPPSKHFQKDVRICLKKLTNQIHTSQTLEGRSPKMICPVNANPEVKKHKWKREFVCKVECQPRNPVVDKQNKILAKPLRDLLASQTLSNHMKRPYLDWLKCFLINKIWEEKAAAIRNLLVVWWIQC